MNILFKLSSFRLFLLLIACFAVDKSFGESTQCNVGSIITINGQTRTTSMNMVTCNSSTPNNFTIGNSTNLPYQCYSMSFNYNNTMSGIIQGCSQINCTSFINASSPIGLLSLNMSLANLSSLCCSTNGCNNLTQVMQLTNSSQVSCPINWYSNLTLNNTNVLNNSSNMTSNVMMPCPNNLTMMSDPDDQNGYHGYQCYTTSASVNGSVVLVQGCAGARLTCNNILSMYNTSYTRSCCIGSSCFQGFQISNQSNQSNILPNNYNPFSNLDPNVVFVIKSYNQAASNTYVTNIAGNTTGIAVFFDMLTSLNFWKSNCPAANAAYQYLEDALVLKNDSVTCSLARLLAVMPCRPNCNFNRLLSVSSSLSANISDFATRIMPHLNPSVGQDCKTTLGKYITLGTSASSVISNINSIGLYTPSQLGNFSQNNTLQIAQALTSGGQTISGPMAKSLGQNIPPTSSLTGIASIASGVPLAVFNNTAPSSLVGLLGSMDLGNMDSFRKGFIGSLIVSSNSSSVISNMLMNCSDSSIINSIPTRMFTSLNINVSTIPATNLPPAFLKSYSRTILASNTLASITDSGTLQKILPGITNSDLNAISDSSKINTIVNLVSASISSGISLTYVQRTAMLNSLLNSLSKLSNSATPATYLSLLNTTHMQSLYVLFIEANSTILSALSKLSTFSTVVSQAATLTSSQCCNYLRSGRQLFTTFAINATITNTVLQYSDLLTLGACFATTIPTSYLQTMNSSVFVSYFASAGVSFQPDATQQTIVTSLISSAASTQSSLETYVFSTLNDLAVYYNNFGALNLTYFKNNGASTMTTIKTSRDPTSSSVQLCRIGLTNSASMNSLLSTYGSSFASAYINSPSKRRRRAITTLTCTDINNLAGSLNSLTVDQLSKLSNSDFTSCQTVLGLASNSWTSAQLTQLATQAKVIYPTVSAISDTNIAALNSILLGFSTSDLQSLTFSSLTSISALGALSGWSSAQLTALNTPLMTYITANGMSSTLLTSMANLACALSSTYVSGISSSVFSDSVSTLSKFSLTCPNAAAWYALAKTIYGSTLYNSTSSLTELGSIISGISSSDFTSISADAISSVSTSAWTIMPVATVNLMTTTQLNGLSTTAISALVNSPNYSSFSSVIQSNMNSLSTGSTAQTVSSDSSTIKYSIGIMFFNICLAFILF